MPKLILCPTDFNAIERIRQKYAESPVGSNQLKLSDLMIDKANDGNPETINS